MTVVKGIKKDAKRIALLISTKKRCSAKLNRINRATNVIPPTVGMTKEKVLF